MCEYKSETAKFRMLLEPYCVGGGIDYGCGGDKITPRAIGIDLATSYASGVDHHRGNDPIQLAQTDVNTYTLRWFKDEVLDYVYSSAVLEDFTNTVDVLKEWIRCIKPNGFLVLVLPDEQIYRKCCIETGGAYNTSHKLANFGKDYIKQCAKQIPNLQLIYETDLIDYCFGIVFKKI